MMSQPPPTRVCVYSIDEETKKKSPLEGYVVRVDLVQGTYQYDVNFGHIANFPTGPFEENKVRPINNVAGSSRKKA